MIFYSPIEPVYYLLPLIGLIVGFFGTLLGGGGGFIFLPVLVLFYDIPAHTAVITSLVATLPIGIAGTVGHQRKGNADFRLARIFMITGLIGAFAGTAMAQKISGQSLKSGFGIYCVLMAFFIWMTTRDPQLKSPALMNFSLFRNRGNIAKGIFFGFPAGIVTGAFGTSGTAPILAGLLSMKVPVKRVVGTSLLVVTINTLFAIGAHFLVGQIDMTLVLMLTVGSLTGAILGPKVLANIETGRSEKKIRYLYAGVMALLGIIMIGG